VPDKIIKKMDILEKTVKYPGIYARFCAVAGQRLPAGSGGCGGVILDA
jgi:hypothetical protein